MADVYYSRPIRKAQADINGGSVVIIDRPTRVNVLSVTPAIDDAIVDFRNGPGGEILWTIEADNASGTRSVPFGRYPLDFTQGIVAEVNKKSAIQAICVAVIEPRARGTS